MNSIIELRDKLDNGSLNTDELFNNSIELAKKYQDEYNSDNIILLIKLLSNPYKI